MMPYVLGTDMSVTVSISSCTSVRSAHPCTPRAEHPLAPIARKHNRHTFSLHRTHERRERIHLPHRVLPKVPLRDLREHAVHLMHVREDRHDGLHATVLHEPRAPPPRRHLASRPVRRRDGGRRSGRRSVRVPPGLAAPRAQKRRRWRRVVRGQWRRLDVGDKVVLHEVLEDRLRRQRGEVNLRVKTRYAPGQDEWVGWGGRRTRLILPSPFVWSFFWLCSELPPAILPPPLDAAVAAAVASTRFRFARGSPSARSAAARFAPAADADGGAWYAASSALIFFRDPCGLERDIDVNELGAPLETEPPPCAAAVDGAIRGFRYFVGGSRHSCTRKEFETGFSLAQPGRALRRTGDHAVEDDTLPVREDSEEAWDLGQDRSRSGGALWRSLDASRRQNVQCPQSIFTSIDSDKFRGEYLSSLSADRAPGLLERETSADPF